MRRKRLLNGRLLSVLTAALVSLPVARADTAASGLPPTVEALMNRDLVGMPDKEALLMTVTYLPGGSSLPHRHDAQVFVYVLEGAVTMQIDGNAPMTLLAGQTFYEGPEDVHRVSANASATEPAKLIVFMIKTKGRRASRDVPAGKAP